MIHKLPYILASLVLFAVILVAVSTTTSTAQAQISTSDFRILDIRSEYGQMVVEVQHFNPDGSHWFYENYTFQGREEYKKEIAVIDGKLFLEVYNPEFSDFYQPGLMEEAPIRGLPPEAYALPPNRETQPLNETQLIEFEYYLPEGKSWLYSRHPNLDVQSILSVIQKIHRERNDSGWEKSLR